MYHQYEYKIIFDTHLSYPILSYLTRLRSRMAFPTQVR